MVLWCLILLLLSAITIGVHSQLDSNEFGVVIGVAVARIDRVPSSLPVKNIETKLIYLFSEKFSHGFLSIDCGLSENSSYIDFSTKLTYVSDEQFIDTGVNSPISPSSISDDIPREFLTVRSFPTGIRNCYTLKPLTADSKYLIRATFYYGNYDHLNNPPTFDIYLGVNFWNTVNSSLLSYSEIIVNTTAEYLQVCLVNKNLGNPFISSLHLRQLNSRIYQFANTTQSLIWVQRANLGGSKTPQMLRYPDDKYDRWWLTETLKGTTEISTNSTLKPDPDFETPSLVMQTAATTSSTQQPLNLSFGVGDASSSYYWILHFYEIQTSSTGVREIDIFINGDKVFDAIIFQTWCWATIRWSGYTNYNFTLVATSNSTLPPLLNGYELYKLSPMGVPTYEADVAAINSIKKDHQIKNGWSGDPCLPKNFTWTGVSCTNSSDIPRIIALNLSSSGLTGPLSYYFGNLNALVSLDLSSNNLSGSLPSSLDQLTALTYLDIRGNSKISTTLPLGLLNKQQNGSLTYWFGDINPTPSPSPSASPSPSSKKNIIISIAVVVPLFIIVVVVAIVFWLRRKNNQPIVPNPNEVVPKPNESFEPSPVANDDPRNYANIPEEGSNLYGNQAVAHGFPNIDNHQFSFNDLKRITNGFKNNIGVGGFGSVYLGLLQNGVQVAVKIRSHFSTQGVEEFLAEARNLARVHHKNLVTLIGYCIDVNCMALVYEYMEEGNLQQKLKDDVRPLTWMQRLRIAYQSALGLEYLHKACNPPLIHRDVKTSNILLSANFEAKIADFGLSRVFDGEALNHVSTRIVGTPGYLDPEYYSSNQLSAKSDVYSFGIVLLEIVTGQSPIVLERGDLTQWVHEKLSGGDIESIVDPKMQKKYEINSVWKVTNVACRCTEHTYSRRPSMSAVVSELKESLVLESSTDSLVTDVSQDDSAFEMAYFYRGGMPAPAPSVR